MSYLKQYENIHVLAFTIPGIFFTKLFDYFKNRFAKSEKKKRKENNSISALGGGGVMPY